MRVRRLSGGDGTDAPVASHNLLLATLPQEEIELVLSQSTRGNLGLRQVVFEANDPIENVYFPLTGICSLVTVLKDGSSIEAMTVGREGFVGLPVFHGAESSRSLGICQVSGEFLEIQTSTFKTMIPKAPELRAALHRFAQFTMDSLSQYSACNSTHLIEQRCARWLLTTGESLSRTEFPLTQEFLSQMLAVRRAGVTVAVGALERQGLISQRYGVVKINDVTGLKKAACECFAVIQEAKREMLSPSP